MIRAHAALGDQVAIVLEHVEPVVGDNAFQFMLRPGLGIGIAQIDRLSFEGLGLPVGRGIGDQPIADIGIARIECAWLSVQAGLSPVHP